MKITNRNGNFKFRDDIKGEYNISHEVTNQEDDDIAAALMLFKVGEITLDEAMCYFGYREYQEGCDKTTKYNHDRVATFVRGATETIRSYL